MKKVLIGCGVVVLLGLGFLGYLAYRVWPNVMNVHTQWAAAIDELNALDRQYPFEIQAQTGLDAARFERMLDVRLELTDYLGGVNERMKAMQKAQESEGGLGLIAGIQSYFELIAPVLTEVAARLGNAQMSTQEFAFHTRVMWAVLSRVDQNLAPKELEELRGRYARYKEEYEALRKDQKHLLSLQDLLASLPLEAVQSAEQLMAADLPRVSRALAVTDADYLYLQPQSFREVEPVEALPPPSAKAAQPAPDPAPATDPGPAPGEPVQDEAAPAEPGPSPVEPAPR